MQSDTRTYVMDMNQVLDMCSMYVRGVEDESVLTVLLDLGPAQSG